MERHQSLLLQTPSILLIHTARHKELSIRHTTRLPRILTNRNQRGCVTGAEVVPQEPLALKYHFPYNNTTMLVKMGRTGFLIWLILQHVNPCRPSESPLLQYFNTTSACGSSSVSYEKPFFHINLSLSFSVDMPTTHEHSLAFKLTVR